MRALSIQSADAFILVYDVTDSSTFDEVRMIRDQIHEAKATTAVPIVVVGNKIDLLEEDSGLREVSFAYCINCNLLSSSNPQPYLHTNTHMGVLQCAPWCIPLRSGCNNAVLLITAGTTEMKSKWKVIMKFSMSLPASLLSHQRGRSGVKFTLFNHKLIPVSNVLG